jgi:hypothetical protein
MEFTIFILPPPDMVISWRAAPTPKSIVSLIRIIRITVDEDSYPLPNKPIKKVFKKNIEPNIKLPQTNIIRVTVLYRSFSSFWFCWPIKRAAIGTNMEFIAFAGIETNPLIYKPI